MRSIGRPAILAALLTAAARAWGGTPQNPVITSTAAADGASLSDTAHVSAGVNPTGTLTFKLYGPNDATCGSPAITSEILSVNGDGDYQTDSVIVLAAGTYRWTIDYSGDGNNNPVALKCNAANESVTITPVTPTITTTASGPVPVGGPLSDTAHLSGGNNPGGQIHFTLFGPDDGTCGTLPVFSENVAVHGNGDVESDSFIATAAGTYRWIASYSGDAANNQVTTKCNDPGESVEVGGASSIAQVPTLGPGMLVLLAFLLGGTGWLLARK